MNSRFLDLFITLPPGLDSYELDIRRRISREIPRGRLTIKVRLEPIGPTNPGFAINEKAFIEVAKKINELSKRAGIGGHFDPVSLLKVPGVLLVKEEEIPKHVVPKLWEVLDRALKRLNKSLREEGRKLEREIKGRLNNISKKVREIQKLKKEEVKIEKHKFIETLRAMGENQNQDERLVQILQRLDVAEEITRLKSHLKAIREIIKSRATIKGRKLEFYCQELHREVTTLSQKSVLPEIVNLTVEMREEIERIKEQVRNIR